MLRYPFALVCLFLLPSTLLLGQIRQNDARDDLRYNTVNQRPVVNEAGELWYGAGAQLGFQGGNNFSYFRVGVSPIVGYKLNNFLSVGPRASLTYNSIRDDFVGFDENFIDWSVGAFTRAKVFRGIFVQAEYSLLSEVDFFGNGDKNRNIRAVPFLGGGFSQGGGPGMGGFEFGVLFRLIQRERLNDSPFQIRTGFNYNF
jgi:hypothetical protein